MIGTIIIYNTVLSKTIKKTICSNKNIEHCSLKNKVQLNKGKQNWNEKEAYVVLFFIFVKLILSLWSFFSFFNIF